MLRICLADRAVLTVLSAQWETPGAMLLPTESRRELTQTLTGSSVEGVQEAVLQLWPHSPATCEGTHSLSCCFKEKNCHKDIQKDRSDLKWRLEIQTHYFGLYLAGPWVQTLVGLLVTLERCVVLWPWSPLMVCCPDMVSSPWSTPWTSLALWPAVSVTQPSS